MSDDETAIRHVISTWMSATKAGDAATVLDLMTDDVVFLVPGQKPFGKEAFAAAAGQQSEMEFDGKSDVEEIKIVGDWAFVRTRLQLAVTMRASGETTRRAGYTLSVFRKCPDGKWRLARDANLLAPES